VDDWAKLAHAPIPQVVLPPQPIQRPETTLERGRWVLALRHPAGKPFLLGWSDGHIGAHSRRQPEFNASGVSEGKVNREKSATRLPADPRRTRGGPTSLMPRPTRLLGPLRPPHGLAD